MIFDVSLCYEIAYQSVFLLFDIYIYIFFFLLLMYMQYLFAFFFLNVHWIGVETLTV